MLRRCIHPARVLDTKLLENGRDCTALMDMRIRMTRARIPYYHTPESDPLNPTPATPADTLAGALRMCRSHAVATPSCELLIKSLAAHEFSNFCWSAQLGQVFGTPRLNYIRIYFCIPNPLITRNARPHNNQILSLV